MAIALALWTPGCGDDNPSGPSWQIVARHLPGALLSVWGTSATDVWVVGADAGDGRGPMVSHFDGAKWTRQPTGQTGDLWWVFGFGGGPVYMGGAGGMILRWDGTAFTKMTTPGTDTVFGIWGASPTDVWAVGGSSNGSQGAFAWRLLGDAWTVAPGVPLDLQMTGALWKVYGRSASDVWLVGTGGKVVHWDGSALSEAGTGTAQSLFTVHANSSRFVAVGGFGNGLILENDGSGWTNVSPNGAPSLIGVCTSESEAYAVGELGAVYKRGASGWTAENTGLNLGESLHSVWIDPKGGLWAAGGQVLTTPLTDGVLLHKGDAIAEGIQ